MKNTASGIPAWMIAQALVVKAKNVLIEDAIDLLYKEIESKRMSISGSFSPIDIERDGEMEQGLFLIRHLVDERPKIMHELSSKLKELEGIKKPDVQTVEKIESTKKFMLAVEQITALTAYGLVFEQWFNDVSLIVNEKDPAKVLAETAENKETRRADALRFLSKSRMFKDRELFDDDERKEVSGALEILG